MLVLVLGMPFLGREQLADAIARCTGRVVLGSSELGVILKAHPAAKEYIEAGRLIPTEIVAACIARLIGSIEADVVLDGIPRDSNQLQEVLTATRQQAAVITLEATVAGIRRTPMAIPVVTIEKLVRVLPDFAKRQSELRNCAVEAGFARALQFDTPHAELLESSLELLAQARAS